MVKLLYGEESRLLPWACTRIGIASFRSDAQAIGLERNGGIVAAVVFDTFSTYDCNIHVASDGTGHWLNKELLVAAFCHPFITCKLRRVTATIASRNLRALKFNRHLGFTQEGFHPYAAGDDAMVSLGLTRMACKYIPPEYRTLTLPKEHHG